MNEVVPGGAIERYGADLPPGWKMVEGTLNIGREYEDITLATDIKKTYTPGAWWGCFRALFVHEDGSSLSVDMDSADSWPEVRDLMVYLGSRPTSGQVSYQRP